MNFKLKMEQRGKPEIVTGEQAPEGIFLFQAKLVPPKGTNFPGLAVMLSPQFIEIAKADPIAKQALYNAIDAVKHAVDDLLCENRPLDS